MPERAILDTSVVLGPSLLEASAWQAAISIVTVAELRFGILVARDDAARAIRLRRFEQVIRSLDALPVDEAVAERYAEIAATVKHQGRQPRTRQFDLLIAATGAAHDATVLTHNPTDFVGLEQLVRVVSPHVRMT